MKQTVPDAPSIILITSWYSFSLWPDTLTYPVYRNSILKSLLERYTFFYLKVRSVDFTNPLWRGFVTSIVYGSMTISLTYRKALALYPFFVWADDSYQQQASQNITLPIMLNSCLRLDCMCYCYPHKPFKNKYIIIEYILHPQKKLVFRKDKVQPNGFGFSLFLRIQV